MTAAKTGGQRLRCGWVRQAAKLGGIQRAISFSAAVETPNRR
jgi:hypothetical protein